VTGARPRLLLADDDETFRERLGRALRDRGYDVVTAMDHPTAMAAAREQPPAFAVIDLKMPGASGLDLVRDLHALAADIRIVVLTGYGSIATATQAIRLGAVDYLTKPSDADQILAALEAKEKKVDIPLTDSGSIPSLARVEWEHIQRVLMDCNGNVSQAARALGLHRRSLQRKLSKRPMPR